MRRRVVCVLGMHRSGTSCLTGTLEEAGVFLGEVSRKNPFNAKGNCENSKIVALHKRLLHDNHASWYEPPRCVRWYDEHRHERDAIIREYQGIAAWGFKDPRTLLTLDGWLEALPDMNLVAIFRHPLAVAQSLEGRNGFPISQGLNLWAQYNERLLAYWKRRRIPMISFDLEPELFKEKLAQILQRMGLPSEAARLSFFDPSLRHQSNQERVALPLPVQRLYQELQEAAL